MKYSKQNFKQKLLTSTEFMSGGIELLDIKVKGRKRNIPGFR